MFEFVFKDDSLAHIRSFYLECYTNSNQLNWLTFSLNPELYGLPLVSD